jgi:serine/threonine protein kinase
MMQLQAAVLPSGTLLHGRYRIEHTISQGGFGNVYLALDQRFNRDVAVKEAYFSDDETRKQFALEAEVLIHTTHEGVVRGFEDFEDNGRFYLVMQYIPGQNLEEMQIVHFQRYQRPLPETVVLPLMSLICAATQALHDGHIIHRDIKPANIKVDERGQPILLDLGLAKLYKDPTSVTLMAARAYTPGYAPPEQCEDGGTTTERTDIYALGATVYYALTGRQPWEALKRLNELYANRSDMPTPRAFVPEITPATDALVMQALALDESQRFGSATAMQRAIEGAYQEVVRTVLCPTCHTVNAPGSTFCGNCGAELHPKSSSAALPSAQSVLLSAVGPAQQEAAAIIAAKSPATLPMPKPEPVAPRIVLKQRPRVSFRAAFALILSIIAVFVPVLGALFGLFIIIPVALSAGGNIRASKGAIRGMGRVVVAIIITLGNIAAWVYLVQQTFAGKLHPFG